MTVAANDNVKPLATDRRKTERIQIPLRIEYQPLFQKQPPQELFTRDVSGGGMRLVSDRPFKKGERIRSSLYFPSETRPVNALDRVVWCKESLAGFDVGVEHVKIEPPDKERFIFLFCEMMLDRHIFSS